MSVGGQTVFVYFETKPKKERAKDGSCKSVLPTDKSNMTIPAEAPSQDGATSVEKLVKKRKQESSPTASGGNSLSDQDPKPKKSKKDKMQKSEEVSAETTKTKEDTKLEEV